MKEGCARLRRASGSCAECQSGCELRMVRGDPALDQIEKIPRFHDDLFSFRMGCNRGMVVVDHIALASAGLEKKSSGRSIDSASQAPKLCQEALEFLAGSV